MDGDFQIKIQIFSGSVKVTPVNRLREIQYKLLHGALYTRDYFLIFDFVEDNLCPFCNQ